MKSHVFEVNELLKWIIFSLITSSE